VSRILNNRRLFILLVSVILLIVIAGLTFRSQGRKTSWPERVVMDTENTVGGWIYRPVSAVAGFIGGIQDLHDMYVQNSQLKSELQNYAALEAQLKQQTEINSLQAKMLNFKQLAGTKMKFTAAHVIGRDPSQWNSEITLDVGQTQGVHENMAVLAADGSLVGRVEQAAQYSCKVLLITDTEVGDGVSALVQNQTAQQPFGVVEGSSSVTGQLDMNFLSLVAQIHTGDSIITSGLSDIYPPGILIGTIVKVQTGTQGLTQAAVIKPAANFDYLQDVFVVTSPVHSGSVK